MSQPTSLARPVPGGRSVYGAPLGILMLEARFARIPGDMGNALTWPFPVLYRVVRGASPQRVVLDQAAGLLPGFIDAAQELVQQGAEAITTNCGFLSLFQAELAAAVRVPVATSALMQVAAVQATLPPGRRVGVVTINAAALTPAHLRAVGAPPDTPLAGVEQGRELYRGATRRARRRPRAVATPPRHRRHRARVHQHAALCGGAARRTRGAGVRHLFVDQLVPRRPAAARVRLTGFGAEEYRQTPYRSPGIGSAGFGFACDLPSNGVCHGSNARFRHRPPARACAS
jgi:hypothetical protein